MADTQRTKSAIQTLFADNTSGAISPQDLRDFVESCAFNYGGAYMNLGTAAATTVSGAGTFYQTNWNSLGAASNVKNFTVSTAGRLTYTGTPTVHAHIACTISYSVAVAAAKELEFRIAKNGTTAAGSAVIVNTNGNTTKESTAIHWDAMMTTNDYLELHVANNTDTTDVTLEMAYLFAMGMFM